MPAPAGTRVPFVGLTGGLGAGKSTALEALAELGAATFSTDAAVHELLASEEVRDLVVEKFGSEVAPDGAIDRGAVATHVFANPDDRKWLEEMLWPRVGKAVVDWRAEVEAREPPPPAAVVETPLLFEAGMESVYEHTIAVVAQEETRSERAAARGHQAVEERAGRQLSQDEKAQRADFAVRNDGTREELKETLSRVLDTIGS
jgi:dephospho-CoA kinase